MGTPGPVAGDGKGVTVRAALDKIAVAKEAGGPSFLAMIPNDLTKLGRMKGSALGSDLFGRHGYQRFVSKFGTGRIGSIAK